LIGLADSGGVDASQQGQTYPQFQDFHGSGFLTVES
jgi:hypothetical protein